MTDVTGSDRSGGRRRAARDDFEPELFTRAACRTGHRGTAIDKAELGLVFVGRRSKGQIGVRELIDVRDVFAGHSNRRDCGVFGRERAVVAGKRGSRRLIVAQPLELDSQRVFPQERRIRRHLSRGSDTVPVSGGRAMITGSQGAAPGDAHSELCHRAVTGRQQVDDARRSGV